MTEGQIEIFENIFKKQFSRVHIETFTQYGKSDVVSMAVLTRVSTYPEKWAIVAPTEKKAKIIIGYLIKHIFENEYTKQAFKIEPSENEERIKRERSKNRLTFDVGNGQLGEVFIASAEAHKTGEDAGNALMGFGAQNLIEDESALIPDSIHTKAMRMVGGHKENFVCKIGNPFKRNHFLRSHNNPKYHKILIDYKQGLKEGRITEEFIEEMRGNQLFDILYECKFPEADMIDEKGFTPLLIEQDLRFTDQVFGFGDPVLGVDVAEGGANFNVILIRFRDMAKVVYRWQTENLMEVVGRVIEVAKEYRIKGEDIFMDTIGVGKGVADRLQEQHYYIQQIKGSENAINNKDYENKRAENFFGLKQWIKEGGQLYKGDNWSELLKIKYKIKDSSGKSIIMSKDEMRRYGIESPDIADALALTFSRPLNIYAEIKRQEIRNTKKITGIGFQK